MDSSLLAPAVPMRRFQIDRGILAIVLAFALSLPLLTPRVYAVDSVEYYVYLRSLIFDGDLDFTNDYAHLSAQNPNAGITTALLDRRDPITGRPINLAPIGTAILWTPAFLLAHGGVLVARALGAPILADGYSRPYIWAVSFATALYGLGGLLLSYALARRYTGVWPATVAVLACWFASPVLFFMFISPPWSHVPAMFVVALFIFYWARTRDARTLEARTLGQWMLLGLLGGLMTLCREQLGLFLLIPALAGVHAYWVLGRARRWTAMRTLFARHWLFLLMVILTLIPQFLVYRPLNGRWGPSTIVSGKLGWWSAHFFDTLIDPTHGALFWTPVWFFAIVGLPLLWRRDRSLALLLGLVLVAQVYVNGAFGTTWHLTGSFGFRRLIEATPIFVVGLALLIERLHIPRSVTTGLCALLIAWNLGLIVQWSLPPRPIRDGLVWHGMLQRQLAVPGTTLSRLGTFLFERCKLVENGNCQ